MSYLFIFKSLYRLKEKAVVKKSKQVDQLKKGYESLKESQTQLWLKQNGVEFSLATSQANYIDPRITVAWSKKNKVPLEKIWSATLRKKYAWAAHTSPNFRF